MSLKDRIKKLEQHPGVKQERAIGLCIMSVGVEPTREQIDAFEAKIDWTKGSPQAWAWTGDKFVCTLSEYLQARGHEVENVDPEREITLCHLKGGTK